MRKFFKKLFKPLYPIIGLGYGRCYCCGAPWNITDSHTTYIDCGRGCFAICEDCWKEKSDEEIMRAYLRLYTDWECGDKFNRPLTTNEIGFTREELRNALTEELKKRKFDGELYKQEIIEFLGDEGLEYLEEYYKQDKLILPWGSALYGSVGMQVRNHLRNKHPEIDKKMESYGDFEDWSWKVINEIMEEQDNERD